MTSLKRIIYVGSKSYLSLKQEQLLIENRENGDVNSIPIEDIASLELDNHSIVISVQAIRKLSENNVVVMFCDDKHIPLSLALPIAGNFQLTKRFHAQLSVSKPRQKNLWQQIIRAKIKNQAAILKLYGKDHIALLKLAENVKSGDSTNREAAASKYYWKTLFDEIGFRRDPEGDYPNNMLNYGYIVLRSLVARALVSTGLNPSLGIFHKNQFNPFCLADDMMEPFRPVVDKIVFEKYSKLTDDLILSKEHKRAILEFSIQDMKIEAETHPLMIAVQILCNDLNKVYAGVSQTLNLPQLCD